MDTVRRKIIHWLGGGLLGIIVVFFTSMVKRSIMPEERTHTAWTVR